jgi:hypothetical protein
MKNWCKIIEMPEHDVLLQRLSDNENLEHISVSVKIDGALANFKLSYKEDEKLANETFEKFDGNDAQKIIDSVLEMFKP